MFLIVSLQASENAEGSFLNGLDTRVHQTQ